MPVKNLRIPKDGEKNDSGVPFSNNPADKSLAPELANIAGAPMPRFCGC